MNQSLTYKFVRKYLCNLCSNVEDSNERMLIESHVSETLWSNVESWICEIGVLDYTITNKTNLLGELNKAYWLNIVILNTKKQSFYPNSRTQFRTSFK